MLDPLVAASQPAYGYIIQDENSSAGFVVISGAFILAVVFCHEVNHLPFQSCGHIIIVGIQSQLTALSA